MTHSFHETYKNPLEEANVTERNFGFTIGFILFAVLAYRVYYGHFANLEIGNYEDLDQGLLFLI